MRLFGFDITRAKGLTHPVSRGGWLSIINEPWAGAWQRNIKIDNDAILTYSAVYACITLIASDVGKLRLRLMREDDGIPSETESPAYSPVLRKPNRYQTRVKFFENWVTSKLTHGNTYVLKQRDARNVVVALYILDPTRVQPLIADDGSVFYQLHSDNLAGIPGTVTVPAREVIHDVMVPLYHPLVGVSPLHASGLAATQGIKMQENQTRFFQNHARPPGILTAPAHISDDTALRIKEDWQSNYGGENLGKTAVLGDGLTYTTVAINAVDAQYIEQLKWTAEVVCSTFHVPQHKIGIGERPTFNNIQNLDQQYYSNCLQIHIESIEAVLDEGLELTRPLKVEFDLDDLMRMDAGTLAQSCKLLVEGGIMSPDEARRKFDLPSVKGGGTPYLQQQNYSLAALDERDRNKPFDAPPQLAPEAPPQQADPEDGERFLADLYHRAARIDGRDHAAA